MSQQQNVATDTAEAREKSQPNLAAYFLTVGLVTIAFGSVFSLVFSGTVTLVLVAVVIAVAIISVAAGLYSDSDLLFPEV
jgi:heme/copper-type cytochrome/quinol oxidase subunit 4